MTTIYLDPSAVETADAADRLSHLTEAGHELVLVDLSPRAPASRRASAATKTSPAPIAWRARTRQLPPDPPQGSWFLTGDPAACGDRQPGLRTVLIGPSPEHARPTRCDMTARDLRDAVLEILTSDAMG
jgi:hypothetical protein